MKTGELKFAQGTWEYLTFSSHELQVDFSTVKIGKRVYIIGHDEEDKANANLIAAAPELYEALANMVALARPHMRDDTEMLGLMLAETALAKARGEL